MKYEIEQMLKQGGGAIVNTASTWGLVGAQRASADVTSKHAVVGLTRAAALEYAQQGRRLRVIAPAVAGLVAGIALWLVMSLSGTAPTPGFGVAHGTPSPTAEPLTPQAWDDAVLIPSELEDWNGDIEQTEELPEEYLALASAIFGDR